MLSIEALKEFGCDADSGLRRCVNSENFYFKLIKTVPSNENFNKLYESINSKNFEEAFQAAHALKGVLSNLSIDPILKPIIEITEHLRNKDDIDYSKLVEEIEINRNKLEKIINE